MDGDTLCECLLRHGHQPPKMLAETLLDLAEREGDPRRRDDRTVLCARIAKPAEPEKKPRLCPYCKSEIADDATRCPHCTSQLD